MWFCGTIQLMCSFSNHFHPTLYACECECLRSGRTFLRMNKQAISSQDFVSATVVLQYNNSSAIKINFIFVNKCHICVWLTEAKQNTQTHFHSQALHSDLKLSLSLSSHLFPSVCVSTSKF